MMFSIIIPVYNVAPYLRECLGSVLAQTFTAWEAICVDDGSTDGSGEILDEYAAKDPRFKVIHQQNAGVSAARNAALDVAQGEWICFIDPDDIYSPYLLETIWRYVNRYLDLDACRFLYTHNQEQLSLHAFNGDVVIDDVSKTISRENLRTTSLMSWQYAFRASVCGDIRFRNYICGEDRFYTFECLECCQKVAKISAVYYYHRVRIGAYGTSVIHTYRGWEGEILYRIDFMRHLLKSQKEIEFEGIDWIVRFFTYEYLHELGSFSNENKLRLWKIWRNAIGFLATYRFFSFKTRLWFSILRLIPSRLMSCELVKFMNIRKYIRYECKVVQPIARLYRWILGHGEYAR